MLSRLSVATYDIVEVLINITVDMIYLCFNAEMISCLRLRSLDVL